MEGQIKRIIADGKFVTYLVQIKETKKYGRTYTGSQYRNFVYWQDLKVGDYVAGLQWWKDEKNGLIDADSPVHLLQETLF